MLHVNDVIFVASCNVDLISYVKRLPKLGETINGTHFKIGFGGKGANKCIAASRLGCNCAIVCKLGNDIFGKNYFDNLKQNNIETKYITFSESEATGVAPITVDENGNNSIIVCLGANLELSPKDVDNCQQLFEKSKILITNLEIPIETAQYALRMSKKHENMISILNFAPAITEINENFFEYVDILILNETEVETLIGKVIESIEDGFDAIRIIRIKFIGNQVGIAVTLGDKGVVWCSASGESFHVKCPQVQVVDTCGAGDAFCGAFAHYLSKLGLHQIRKVIEVSCEYASLTVQSKGTQTSYPHLKNIDEKFRILQN